MATPTNERYHPRGSGHDINSDLERLRDEQNRQDKIDEDSFPSSDPPSYTPMTGFGRADRERAPHDEIPEPDPSGLEPDFKNDKAAQFEYGRKSQASTQHFDTSTNRLRKGNPDIGDVDLGTIEADEPAQRDDDDLDDTADDK